jgi:hypothetical protein
MSTAYLTPGKQEDRQTDRETERQTDRETNRWTEPSLITDQLTDTETKKWKNLIKWKKYMDTWQTDIQTDRTNYKLQWR